MYLLPIYLSADRFIDSKNAFNRCLLNSQLLLLIISFLFSLGQSSSAKSKKSSKYSSKESNIGVGFSISKAPLSLQ